MRRGQAKQPAKQSLKELLAQHPEPQRNDWTNGRPNVQGRIGPDGFPEYDPHAFGDEDEDDDDEGPSAGGAFAALAGLEDGDSEWAVVAPKTKKKPAAVAPAAAGPSASTSAASSNAAVARRAAGLGASTSRPASSFATASPGQYAVGAAAGAGGARAPYTVTGAGGDAGPPRAPRTRTHDADGRPISDNYYQTFQKVYRNASGAVCMRFHKTDVVMVKLNGDVVVTSGGFRTRTTYLTVAEGLEPLGLRLLSSGREGNGDWSVELADGSVVAWADNMTLPARTAEERGRGELLYAAYNPGGGRAAGGRAATAADAGPVRPMAAPPSASHPRAAGPGAATAAWSYRTASGAPSSSTGPSGSGYAPPLRPPGASVAESTRDPSVAAANRAASGKLDGGGRDGGDESLHALLTNALLLQDEALIDGNQVQAEHLLDDEHCCIACMAALKSTILIPCGHMVLCAPCAADVMGRSGACPMCRATVTSSVTVS